MKKQMGAMIEKYYIKTRGISFTQKNADVMGIKRIYNYTSDLDFMDYEEMQIWSRNLYNRAKGEEVLIESSIKTVKDVQLYIMTCIVFYTEENRNLYFYRFSYMFRDKRDFLFLLN